MICLSKTQAIRQFLAGLDVSPLAIAETLAAPGFRISPTQVFIVQTKLASPILSVPEPQTPPRHIPVEEGKVFYKLYAALCSYANSKLKLVPEDFSDPKQFRGQLTKRKKSYARPLAFCYRSARWMRKIVRQGGSQKTNRKVRQG